MKKILVTILSLVYFVASSCVLLRQHYCMGDLVDTQIDFGQLVATNTCGDCGMEEGEDSCCESKMKFIKKIEDQKATDFQVLSLDYFSADLLPNFYIYPAIPVAAHRAVPVLALQKPPPKSVPVFLENRNLRI